MLLHLFIIGLIRGRQDDVSCVFDIRIRCHTCMPVSVSWPCNTMYSEHNPYIEHVEHSCCYFLHEFIFILFLKLARKKQNSTGAICRSDAAWTILGKKKITNDPICCSCSFYILLREMSVFLLLKLIYIIFFIIFILSNNFSSIIIFIILFLIFK